MQTVDATVLYTPEEEAWRFLPEGPYRCPDGRISWVSIQHGRDSTNGSLHLLSLEPAAGNQNFPLPGRPGFAFPTANANEFVIGMERSVVRWNVATGESSLVCDGIDAHTSGTIINDGVVYDGHLIFGCKDVTFTENKAGLYLLRRGERQAVLLDSHQICSNGKAIVADAQGHLTLYDIDSPSKQVLGWPLDLKAGKLGTSRVVVDLTAGPVFPDGMILTPDEKSVIIAFYDPRDIDFGEARQYDIATGTLQYVWRCPGSPRVTCPQLIRRAGKIELLLTTADEGMSPELRKKCPHAGCLFVAETSFDTLNDAPIW